MDIDTLSVPRTLNIEIKFKKLLLTFKSISTFFGINLQTLGKLFPRMTERNMTIDHLHESVSEKLLRDVVSTV